MATVNKISNKKVYDQVQVMLEDKATIAATVRNETALAEKGNDKLDLPTRLPRTASVVTVGSSINLTSNANQYESDELTLNKIAADYVELDVHSEQENIFDGKIDAVQDMIKAMAVALDKELISVALAAATEAEDERITSTPDFYKDVINLRKSMRKAKIPFDGSVFLALTPEDEAVALATKEFKSYNENGSGSAIKNGIIGEILGFKVVLPTISDDDGFTESFGYHSLGLVYAWHGNIVIQEGELGKNLKKSLAVSRKFGAKATQSGALVYKWKAPTP